MDIIYLEGEEARAADREIDANLKQVQDFMKRSGAKSGEALVMSDPPVSDVDAD